MKKNEETYDQVTLTLEDNSELLCDVIGIFPCGERQYIALTPADEKNGTDAFMYRFEGNIEDPDNIKLTEIESDEEFEEAADAYDEFLDYMEYLDFADDDEEEEDR